MTKLLKLFAVAWLAMLSLGALSAQSSTVLASGNITTQNLVAAGTCTTGGCVEIGVTGESSLSVQVTGTYTGALSGQVTLDGATWVTLGSASTFTRQSTGVASATITSGQQDVYAIAFPAGAVKVRITGLAAVTGTAAVTLQTSTSGGGVSSGGGGGGAVTIADGAAVSLGAQADTVCATDTGTCTLIALVKKTNSDIAASNAQLPTTLGQTTGSASLSVVLASDQAYSSSANFTSGTTAYAAQDVAGGAMTFATICPTAGRVMITSVALRIDSSAVISGQTSYELHLYDVTPPSAIADSSAFDLPSGDRASYLGKISLGTPVDLGSTLYVGTDGVNKQVKCASASTTLYGYLVSVGAYTPTAQVYTVQLHAVGL